MARRRSVYGKKKRINIIPILIILLLVALLVFIVMKLFPKNDYADTVDEVLSFDILKITGSISTVSSIDTEVYENDKIRYTNKHDNIKKLNSFDGTITGDLDEVGTAKILLEDLNRLQKSSLVTELPKKDNGYYWFDLNVVVEDDFLIFEGEDEYHFDLYYDKEENIVYVKEKYYDEFSKKNNKLQLQGYIADEQYQKLIEELV